MPSDSTNQCEINENKGLVDIIYLSTSSLKSYHLTFITASTTLSTLGYSNFGVHGLIGGGLLGFLSALIDEFCISQKYVNQHIFSISLMWFYLLTPYKNYLGVSNFYKFPLLAAISAVIASKSIDFFDINKVVEEPIKSRNILHNFLGSKYDIPYVSSLLLNTVPTVFINLLSIYMGIFDEKSLIYKIIRNFFDNTIGFNNFKHTSAENAQIDENDFETEIIDIHYLNYFFKEFIPLQLHEISTFINSIPLLCTLCSVGFHVFTYYLLPTKIKDFINFESNNLNSDIIKRGSVYLSNYSNSMKLKSYGSEGQALESSFINDLFVSKRGALQLSNFIVQHVNFLFSLYMVASNSPEWIIAFVLPDLYYKNILHDLIQNIKNKEKNLRQFYNEAETNLNFFKFNADQIGLRDTEYFIKKRFDSSLLKYDELSSKIRNLKAEYSWKEIYHKTVKLVFYIIYASYDALKQIKSHKPNLYEVNIFINKKIAIWNLIDNISQFFLSNPELKKKNIELELSNDRLKKYFEIIKVNSNSEVIRMENNDNMIIIEDYSISIHQKFEDRTYSNPFLYSKTEDKVYRELLRIEKLSLQTGCRYLLSGDNGSGKSTFLRDLKAGLYGELKSKGLISLPVNSTILMLDQAMFLPIGLPLNKVITFPIDVESLAEDHQDLIKSTTNNLIQELSVFGSNLLDALMDNSKVELSGGQRKKIGIIQIILQAKLSMQLKKLSPSDFIIIMDETFAELDQRSRAKAKELLKEHLPGATFLIIDHDVIDSNQDDFFEQQIYFSSYKFICIDNSTDLIDEETFGCYKYDSQIFCKTTERPAPIHLEEDKLSPKLYHKINSSFFNVSDTEIKLTKSEQKEIKDYAYSTGYPIKNSWISKETNLTLSIYNNHKPKDIINSDVNPNMPEIRALINCNEILNIAPHNIAKEDAVLYQKLIGLCSNQENTVYA